MLGDDEWQLIFCEAGFEAIQVLSCVCKQFEKMAKRLGPLYTPPFPPTGTNWKDSNLECYWLSKWSRLTSVAPLQFLLDKDELGMVTGLTRNEVVDCPYYPMLVRKTLKQVYDVRAFVSAAMQHYGRPFMIEKAKKVRKKMRARNEARRRGMALAKARKLKVDAYVIDKGYAISANQWLHNMRIFTSKFNRSSTYAIECVDDFANAAKMTPKVSWPKLCDLIEQQMDWLRRFGGFDLFLKL